MPNGSLCRFRLLGGINCDSVKDLMIFFDLFIYFHFLPCLQSFVSFAIGFGQGLQSHFVTSISVRCQSHCTLVSSSFFVCLPCLGDGVDFSLFSRDFQVLWILFIQ